MSSATKIETDKQAISETVETSIEDNPDIPPDPLSQQTEDKALLQQDEQQPAMADVQKEVRQIQSVAVHEREYEHAQSQTVELEEQTIIQAKTADHREADTSNTRISTTEVTEPISVQETYEPEDAEVVVEASRDTQEEVATDQAAEENTVIPQLKDEILIEQPEVQFDKNTLQEDEPYTAIMADTKTVAEFSAGIIPHENTPVTSAAELQKLIDALPDVEESELHLAADEESSETASTETEFIGQLVQYVQALPENPERPQAEQPIAILAEIVRTAQEIHVVQNDNSETDNLETEHLRQLCTKLFEELGIEADEEVVARIADALVAYAAANEKAEQTPEAMSIEELAQQGTHEYKLASWFNQFFSYSKPLPHLVGTAALRLSKLSTSI